MHVRKKYLIYPPNYRPGDGYVTRHSKFQAWKVAVRMGAGAAVDVSVQRHRSPRIMWYSSSGYCLWDVVNRTITEEPKPC